ncbi:alpha/beta fold hydrolase [Tessaracoccus terricola]
MSIAVTDLGGDGPTVLLLHGLAGSSRELRRTAEALAVFAAHGMFSSGDKDELIRRRPATARSDLRAGSHDAHLDAFDDWVTVLTDWLVRTQ